MRRRERGFTLVELMVVIAIIALLAAILFPNLKAYMNRSKVTALITAGREIATGLTTMYINKTDGNYPTVSEAKNSLDVNKKDPFTGAKVLDELYYAHDGIYYLYNSQWSSDNGIKKAMESMAKGDCASALGAGTSTTPAVIIDISGSDTSSGTVYVCK